MQSMKKILIFILLCVGFIANGMNTPDSLFLRGNEYYQAGNYEKAIDSYLEIDSMGYYSPELYYNLGNTYFRSNKLGRARLYLERAVLSKPGEEDYQANLEYLKSMLPDKFDEVPELFLKTWLREIVNLTNTDGWMKIAVLFFILFIIGGLLYIFSSNLSLRRSGFYGGLLFLFIGTTTLVFSLKQNQRRFHSNHAIILEASQTVHSAPRESGKQLFVLHEGSKVKLEKELEGWIEIKVSDGRKGWIPASSAEEI